MKTTSAKPQADRSASAQSDAGRLNPNTRLYLLSATFFFIFMGAGAQQAYLIPYLGRVTDWSRLQCSLVIGSVYLSMVVFRTANLFLFRSWSDRRFTIVGTFAYLAFTLVMGATFWLRSFPLALAAAWGWGIGAALMWTGTTMQVLRLGDQGGGKHGSGMGILYCSTHAGWLSGAVLLGIIYHALPQNRLWGLYAAAAVFTLLGNALACLLPSTGIAVREPPSLHNMIRIMTRPRAQIAATLQFLSALAYGLLLGMFGRFIEQTYGGNWVWISVSLYPATRMIVSLAGGRLSDRIGHAPVLVAGFALGALGLGILGLWDSPYAAAVAGFTLGLLSSTVPVVAAAMVGDAAERKRRPLAYGVLFAWRDLGVVAAAIGSNSLAASLPPTSVFLVFAAVFACCAMLSGMLAKFAHQKF